mmetsp:Transcript_21186/g.42052  ORF Transcript_21186/g.42052 Transcript_21186/m.42052 type:complete len:114 (-) Transcript_21186:18-359(-)
MSNSLGMRTTPSWTSSCASSVTSIERELVPQRAWSNFTIGPVFADWFPSLGGDVDVAVRMDEADDDADKVDDNDEACDRDEEDVDGDKVDEAANMVAVVVNPANTPVAAASPQ